MLYTTSSGWIDQFDSEVAKVNQFEMSVITAVTLVIYGFVMRRERTKRMLARQKPSTSSNPARAQAPRIESLLLLKLALSPFQMPRRKLG